MSQWTDNCDTITWILISSSLDIDFIQGDIHGRSFKEMNVFVIFMEYWEYNTGTYYLLMLNHVMANHFKITCILILFTQYSYELQFRD